MEKIYVEADYIVCKNRLLDGNKVLNYLLENNYSIVDNPKDADTIFFITCAARKFSADHSLKRIKKLQKYSADLVVAGCLPAIEKQRLSKIFNGKTIITKNLENIDKIFPGKQKRYCTIKQNNNLLPRVIKNNVIGIIHKSKFVINLYNKLKIYIIENLYDKRSFIYSELETNPTYYIRVSKGCLGNCSYCAIKKATGDLVSKPVHLCVEEFKKGLKRGFNRFILTGDDVGAYGIDIGSTLPVLLQEITKIPGDYKIIVQSLDPKWIVKYVEELEEIILTKKISDLYATIQSANPRILKLMNRYSNIKKIRESFQILKKSCPDLRIVVHYLCGFPTETQEEVKDTLNFIIDNKLVGFVMSFSSRPDTIAETLQPKISDKEIYKRLKYSKKILNNNGYNVIYFPKVYFLMFDYRFY